MMLRVAVKCIAVALILAAAIDAAPPQLSQVQPLAVTPATTVEVALRGEHLTEPRRLWTTFPHKCVFRPPAEDDAQDGKQLIAQVTLPRDVQVGVAALRIATNQGVSNPLLLLVDDLTSVPAASDNHASESAQILKWPVAVDGHCDAIQEDWFRFHVKAGQRLSFEVVAQQLGSKLDSVLRLMDSAGQEIARVDDSRGAGGDSRFFHQFDAEGEYFLTLRDVRHSGGEDYRYRLRVGAFPLVTCAYPLGGRGGTVGSFDLIGEGLDRLSPVLVTLPNVRPSPSIVPFSVTAPDASGSGWFRVEVGQRSEFSEVEPNDDTPLATPVELPCAINGRLSSTGDQDRFQFTAKKGQWVRAEAVTHELGSPCELHLRLLRLDGSQVAEGRQESTTQLATKIPTDGQYVLLAENLFLSPAGDQVYRLHLTEEFSGFSLAAEHAQYSSPHGGTFVVKVSARRRNFSEPIDLSLRDVTDSHGSDTHLLQRAELEGQQLKGNETQLKITLPSEIQQGDVRLVEIVGKAEVEGQTVTATAEQDNPLATILPNAFSYPAPLRRTIAVGVGPPFPPFFEFEVPRQPIHFPQLVGQSSFEIKIHRTHNDFKDEIKFEIEDLPEGIKAEVQPVEEGREAYQVTLAGPPDLELGESTIRIMGTGKFQEQTRSFTLDHVSLRVVEPLLVFVAMAGPIAPGRQQVAQVRITRFGEDPQPVRVQFSEGPPHISAPIQLTIPSDAAQADVMLTAADEATPGTFSNLIVVASTEVQGETITVRSDPAELQVQLPNNPQEE